MNRGSSRRTTSERRKLRALGNESVRGDSLGKKKQLPSELDWGRTGEFQKGSGHLARPDLHRREGCGLGGKGLAARARGPFAKKRPSPSAAERALASLTLAGVRGLTALTALLG